MKTISLSDLKVPENRQRREFDPKRIQELADSILSKGLMHPPVVRVEASGYVLVAGERRLRAITSLSEIDVGFLCNGEFVPPGFLPVTLLGDLSPLAIMEAELEENTVRVDLSWAEQAEALARLHTLRGMQAAEHGATQSIKATASEVLGREAVGADITKVNEAVVLAKHLDDPEVARAKSAKEAMKIVRKKAEAEHRAKLAEAFNPESSPHILHKGDALQLMREMPSESADVILTDPPYGVGADGFGDMAGTGHAYADTSEYAEECYTVLATEGFRIAKVQAHMYVFCDIRDFQRWSLIFEMAGWDVWPRPLIWYKTNGMLPKPDFGPRNTYEAIIFASKGNRKVVRVGAPDVLVVPTRPDILHGAQKPVHLFVDLLSRSVLPGETVYDFFCGSGTIFPAAAKSKCRAVGIEMNEEYYNIALSRINDTDDTTIPDLDL